MVLFLWIMGLERPLRKRAVAHFYAVGESLQLETHPTWIYIKERIVSNLLFFCVMHDIIFKKCRRNDMVRFFVSHEELELDKITLTGENAAHAKVLRLRIGEQALVCDGQGNEALCAVENISTGTFVLNVISRGESTAEPKVQVSVYMALPKADKLEHVIQKATELGAYEIVTFPSARCVAKPDEKSLSKKLERWQKIAASAAEQSGRGRIPEVVVLPSFSAALERAANADLPIMFYENEHATTLRMALESGSYRSISLLSGPEGGLEPREVEMAGEKGLRICTLGSRILRCETAPLCGLSAVMYASGEF